jgi:hypothetical protein
MEKFLQNRAASHVWTIAADMTDDENLRAVHSIMDAVKARIPGVREGLDPKRNVLGEPISAPMANNPVARAMSPVSYSESVSDPVKTELANLRHGFTPPSYKYQGLDLSLFRNAAGQTASDYRAEQVGKVTVNGMTIHDRLEKLIASKRYQALEAPKSEDDTTNPRIMEINKVLYDYRQRATEKMLRAFPEVKKTVDGAKKRLTTTPVIQSILNY